MKSKVFSNYIYGLVALLAAGGLVVCWAPESPAQQTSSAEQLRPVEVEPPAVTPRQRESGTSEPSQGFGYGRDIPSGQAFTDYSLTSGEAVSPNLGPANLAKVHSAVSVVQNRGIYGQGQVSIADSLTNVPGYYTSSYSGSPFDATMVLRGFSNESVNRTALVVDGVNTSIARQETNIALAFPEAIERFEVLRGDGNVQFGNKTVGGAINVVLKKPRQNPGVYFGGELGSWGRDREWASVNVVRGDFAGGLFMGRLYEDGWRKFYGDGTPEPTDRPGPWHTNNVIGNFNWKITPKITFDITHLISFIRVPTIGQGITYDMWDRRDLRDIPESYGAKPWLDPGDQRYDNLTIAKLTYDGGPIGKIELRGSHRKYDRDVQTFSFTGRSTWVRWTDLQYHALYSREDTWRFIDNSFRIGGELFDGRYMSSAYYPAASGNPALWTNTYDLLFSRYISGYRPAHAWFFHDTMTLWNRVVFNASYRRQYHDLDRVYIIQDITPGMSTCLPYEGEAWNLSIGLIYDTELGSTIYFKSGKVFRMPNFDDTVNLSYAGYGDAFWILDQEYGKLKEIGLRHWFTRNIYLGVTYYAQDMNNEIYYVYPQNTNVPSVAHEGVEIEAMARITPRWTFKGSYTRQNSVVQGKYRVVRRRRLAYPQPQRRCITDHWRMKTAIGASPL